MSFCFPNEFVEKTDEENYKSYLNRLYEIFKSEISNNLYLNGKEVRIKNHMPEGHDKEEAFYHLTCTDYKGKIEYRVPDLQRSKRINLIKPIIDNVNNCPCEEQNCGTILLWKETIKHKPRYPRYHLFLQDMDYLVVLEDRKNYYLIITAFYVNSGQKRHYLEKHKKYEINEI